MLIGSLVGSEGIRTLDNTTMDRVTNRVIQEITSNPEIDEQIRNNKTIMNILSKVVRKELDQADVKVSR